MSFFRLSFGRLRLAGGAVAVAASLAAAAAPAQAATFTVINTNDSGSGSLRQAILDANSSPGADAITFASGVMGTITLTNGELLISDDLTINGPGVASLTVSGGGGVRVFEINAGVTATLSNVTVANGSADIGAGALNNGTLNVTGSIFSGNSAFEGGGIGNGGRLNVTGSTIAGNSASAFGGGILEFGSLSLASSTLSGNDADFGGGIHIVPGDPDTTIINSTFADDSATSDNSGWIDNFGSGTTIVNSTFSGISGGGLGNFGSLTLQNTIMANSSSGTNCGGSVLIFDGGGNLTWPDTSCPGINQDPMLGALANNGGPTQTMALPAGSPAIDAAVLANCPATDQRGVTRPQGPGCDIGAYERPLFTFAGFFAPVRNPPTFNTAKAGSSVPVKFSLGGNQGTNIFAAGYPKSQQITPCNTTGAPVDGAPATAGTLSYDPVSDRYTYLWKTDKAWAMTCRKLTVRLTDNSDHVAYFNFTK
jgi:hypothetical protein